MKNPKRIKRTKEEKEARKAKKEANKRPYSGGHIVVEEHQEGYESDSEYDGFVIMNPMEVGHATTSILGSAIVRMAKENKDKCLIILYCMSKAQVSQWVDKDGNPTENQKKILETYRKVSQNFNCTIKLKMLKWYYD